MAAVDAASLVWSFLKTNSKASSVRALLVNGATSVYEAGDIGASILSTAEETRDTSGNLNKALALAVQDAGEDLTQWPDTLAAPVVVRVYDRFRGYRNIRAVREALKDALHGTFDTLQPAGKGLMDCKFGGRTGHRFDPVYAVEYEAITFVCTVLEQARD